MNILTQSPLEHPTLRQKLPENLDLLTRVPHKC